MTLKHHKALTPDKWRTFSFGRQLLMIANELNRAGNAIAGNDVSEARLCYERALELLYLTIACSFGKGRLKELCRLKEVLASLYVSTNPQNKDNSRAQSVVVSLSGESFALLNGRA